MENTQRILLVEDDGVFRRLIAKNLINNGFQVTEADDGLAAQKIFDADPKLHQIIISDIRMPKTDGVALLRHVRCSSQVPFVVMTGFSEILESQSAHKLGATGFLPKPLKVNALLEEIHNCLYPKDQKSERPKVRQFRQIHIDEFLTSTHLQSDVYISLGLDHHVKIAHKGEAISLERLKSYRNRVTHLYILEEDFKVYVELNIRLAGDALKSTKMPKEKKALVLNHAAKILAQVCALEKVDTVLVQSANTMIKTAIELVTEDEGALHLLTNVSNIDNPLYAHNVAVSMFAALTAQRYGWASSESLYKVALSGLFHDIGKRELPTALLMKKRALLNPDEILQIETHPVRGREILMQISNVPPEVAQTAFEHHEKMDGTGYPQRLKGNAISPMARLIHLADRFVNYVMPPFESTQKLSPEEALIRLATLHRSEVDNKFLLCLAQVFDKEALVESHLTPKAQGAA